MPAIQPTPVRRRAREIDEWVEYKPEMSATLRFWNSSGDGRLALASVPTISAMDMMGVVDNDVGVGQVQAVKL